MPPVRSLADLDPNATYTYADYLTWQLTEWVELLRGKVAQMAGASRAHQSISGNLHTAIGSYLRQHRPCRLFAAPFDVRLTKAGTSAADEAITSVVQPDLLIVCDPARLDERGCVGAPDWIIEILSPGTATRDWKAKFDLYEENGVGEYWIVAPKERNISVFVRDMTTGHYQSVGDFGAPGLVPSHTLPGLALEWDEVFAE